MPILRLVSAAVLLLLVSAPAVADRRLTVKGPRVVEVGEEVRFPTTGFKPRERLTVSLAPTINRGGNCCGIEVIRRARADANGKAILHWVWPRHYFNGDDRRRWVDGSKADVIALTPAGARGLKVVRVER